jgi:hypothetical protein
MGWIAVCDIRGGHPQFAQKQATMLGGVRQRCIHPHISIARERDTHPQRTEVDRLSVATIDPQRIGLKLFISRPAATASSGKQEYCQYRNIHCQSLTTGTFSRGVHNIFSTLYISLPEWSLPNSCQLGISHFVERLTQKLNDAQAEAVWLVERHAAPLERSETFPSLRRVAFRGSVASGLCDGRGQLLQDIKLRYYLTRPRPSVGIRKGLELVFAEAQHRIWGEQGPAGPMCLDTTANRCGLVALLPGRHGRLRDGSWSR